MRLFNRGLNTWRAVCTLAFIAAGAVASLGVVGLAHAQTPQPVFTIGVLPNVSARVILANSISLNCCRGN